MLNTHTKTNQSMFNETMSAWASSGVKSASDQHKTPSHYNTRSNTSNMIEFGNRRCFNNRQNGPRLSQNTAVSACMSCSVNYITLHARSTPITVDIFTGDKLRAYIDISRGVHSIGRWKQDASWKGLGEAKNSKLVFVFEHRRIGAQSTLGRHFCPKIYMHEKLTKCPNFT